VCENVQKSRLSGTTVLEVSTATSDLLVECAGGDLRRSHEGEQLARLDDTVDIAENGLGLLGLAVLDSDSDTLPAEAANVGVGQLCVVAANHLLDVGHFAVTPAILVRSELRRGEDSGREVTLGRCESVWLLWFAEV
jgi:hypothetical protein